MSFSLFGKKPPSPPPARTGGGVALASASTPRANAPAPRPAPAAPAPSGATPASFAERNPAAEQADLEFTSDPVLRAPRQKPREEVELREVSQTMHPVAEEAAMLYANGREEDARALLESAVKLDLGKAAELVWAELFDLYTLTCNRDAFEALALEYVVRFEKSPPSWSPLPQVNPTANATGPASLALTGKLTAATQAQLEQTRRMSAKNKRLRIDLSKLQDADEAGCTLLLALVQDIAREGKELNLIGAGHFSSLLETKVDAGRPEGRDMWMLLLHLYQQQRRQAPFEELALQYAITFEESPPSWENPPEIVPAEVQDEAPPADTGFVLQGDITGGGSEALGGLHAYSEDLSEVSIDASALRRMDFVSAGMLLNTLGTLARKGKGLRIHGTHALTYALFGVLGINQLARVERRK